VGRKEREREEKRERERGGGETANRQIAIYIYAANALRTLETHGGCHRIGRLRAPYRAAHMRAGAQDDSGLPLLTLERLTFRFVGAGFVLLSATLVVGWLFGEQIYGRAWVWNHKTVFSVLAWLTFAVLLLGRARFGWRGTSAVRMLYVGAALLLLAYVGSRFVLEVLLGRGA